MIDGLINTRGDIMREEIKTQSIEIYLKVTNLYPYRQPPSEDQLFRLFQVVNDKSKEVIKEAAAFLLMLSGLRKKEVVNLKWQNFDSNNHTISIENRFSGSFTIPISANLSKMIRTIDRNQSDYIFSNQPDWYGNVLSVKFKNYVTLADLDSEIKTILVLRHVFVSIGAKKAPFSAAVVVKCPGQPFSCEQFRKALVEIHSLVDRFITKLNFNFNGKE